MLRFRVNSGRVPGAGMTPITVVWQRRSADMRSAGQPADVAVLALVSALWTVAVRCTQPATNHRKLRVVAAPTGRETVGDCGSLYRRTCGAFVTLLSLIGYKCCPAIAPDNKLESKAFHSKFPARIG